MARVKRAVAGRKKRNALAKSTKGYYGVRSRTFRGMKEQAQHSGQYAYRDRRARSASSAPCGSSASTPPPASTACPTAS